ncbi:LysR family transcriptional regulator [Roseibium sp. MMSF_3544]|uniref:LysR family transcriptional regulator n=1 Tax=unclassified Roseibium TaxID=2629323 RepID=UPI00273E97A0|nr:LysR family transcriptional regulator [Roseibium sp. MMSF_3544]
MVITIIGMDDHDLAAKIDRITRELDWNLLRTFMIVVQEGGVTKGAARLGLRQPSVSQALKRLEDRVEIRLIDRSPSTFRVTPAGQHLYQECVDIYGTISRAVGVGQTVEDELTGNVTIAAFSTIQSAFFNDVLHTFHKRHPKVCFQIDVMASGEAHQSVLEKRAGLGICQIYEKDPRLNYELFYRHYFGFFCGSTHPLFGKSNLSLKDLRGHSSVTFKTDQLWDALRPVALMRAHHKLDESVTGYTSHLDEALRMILAGLGFGPLPVHFARRYEEKGILWRLPPYEDTLEIDVQFVTNPKARLKRAEQSFIDFVNQKLVEVPQSERTYTSSSQPAEQVERQVFD